MNRFTLMVLLFCGIGLIALPGPLPGSQPSYTYLLEVPLEAGQDPLAAAQAAMAHREFGKAFAILKQARKKGRLGYSRRKKADALMSQMFRQATLLFEESRRAFEETGFKALATGTHGVYQLLHHHQGILEPLPLANALRPFLDRPSLASQRLGEARQRFTREEEAIDFLERAADEVEQVHQAIAQAGDFAFWR